MTLDFNVFEQTIEQLPSESIPRNGSRKYLNLRFNLGKDWENLTATAYLQHGDNSTPIIVSDRLDLGKLSPSLISGSSKVSSSSNSP